MIITSGHILLLTLSSEAPPFFKLPPAYLPHFFGSWALFSLRDLLGNLVRAVLSPVSHLISRYTLPLGMSILIHGSLCLREIREESSFFWTFYSFHCACSIWYHNSQGSHYWGISAFVAKISIFKSRTRTYLYGGGSIFLEHESSLSRIEPLYDIAGVNGWFLWEETILVMMNDSGPITIEKFKV